MIARGRWLTSRHRFMGSCPTQQLRSHLTLVAWQSGSTSLRSVDKMTIFRSFLDCPPWNYALAVQRLGCQVGGPNRRASIGGVLVTGVVRRSRWAMLVIGSTAGLVAGGITLASAGQEDRQSQTPEIFPEFGSPARPGDAIEGRMDADVDAASARRLTGAPAGWRVWIAKSRMPGGTKGACLLFYAPDAPENVTGPASMCDSAENVRQRGLGLFTETPSGDDISILHVAPAQVSMSVKRGSGSTRAARDGGASRLAFAQGEAPQVEVRSSGGGSQVIDPAAEPNAEGE